MKIFLSNRAKQLGVDRIDASHYSSQDELTKQFYADSYISIKKGIPDEVLPFVYDDMACL